MAQLKFFILSALVMLSSVVASPVLDAVIAREGDKAAAWRRGQDMRG
ncbi:unnamed protein product [Somion occarium]|uniref:Uncharacterized protein n=1 Tax=Somion occarium TaxID=3059160 RepID=A0ABP1E999_9APHY